MTNRESVKKKTGRGGSWRGFEELRRGGSAGDPADGTAWGSEKRERWVRTGCLTFGLGVGRRVDRQILSPPTCFGGGEWGMFMIGWARTVQPAGLLKENRSNLSGVKSLQADN